ncbi:MAG: DUF1501 domain-containing protein, partial [Verrucomicrobiota bacterium]
MKALCTGFDSSLGLSRRRALASFGGGLGSLALASILNRAEAAKPPAYAGGPPQDFLTHAPKAKRVIFLFQSGGPSQHELFDYKPRLQEEQGKELPDSVRQGQRLTGMSGNQASLPLVG